jgi:hypothetical protein
VLCRATVWVEGVERDAADRVRVERIIVAEPARTAAEFAARLRARWAGGATVVTVGPVTAAQEQQ